MSKRPRPNLTTYMEALGQEFDVEPSSIKKVGFQSGVDSVDVTITVDRSVDPFGSLVAAWVSSPKTLSRFAINVSLSAAPNRSSVFWFTSRTRIMLMKRSTAFGFECRCVRISCTPWARRVSNSCLIAV